MSKKENDLKMETTILRNEDNFENKDNLWDAVNLKIENDQKNEDIPKN